jgi:hypothetical protein
MSSQTQSRLLLNILYYVRGKKITRAKHALSNVEGTQRRQVTGLDLSSRANARDLRTIPPFGRNDKTVRFARLATWRDKMSCSDFIKQIKGNNPI